MEKRILERYSRTSDGRMIIDITTDKVGDLYEDFDKSAPYLKKDLDQDLVDYLIDCAGEIGKEKFVIRFRFAKTADNASISRLKMSIPKYFFYLKELEFRELKRMSRTSLILVLIGVSVLTLSVWVNKIQVNSESVVAQVFAEGLTIAAWVSLWEALATFLINWAPHHRQIKLFERIAGAPVFFWKASDTSQ